MKTCFPVFLLILLLVFPVFAEDHVVEKGETALQIAIDHNLTMEQLSQLNPGVDLEMMRVGDVLVVPDEGAGSFEAFLNARYSQLLEIRDLHCELAADQSAVCFFLAENRSELPLFDVRFKGTVRFANGRTNESEGGIGLMQISPGEALPVYLRVPGYAAEIENASVSIIDLSYSEAMTASFRVPDTLYKTESTLNPDGLSAAVTILFSAEARRLYEEKKVNVLLSAFDAEGRVIGCRSLYSDFYQRLDVTVYAQGGRVAEVEVRVEAY